jgi:integrase
MAKIWKRQWKNASGDTRTGWEVAYADQQGARQRRQFTSRKEADAFRVEIESQLRAGTYRPEAEKVTVREAAELFLNHCRERMERRERMTQRNYKVYLGYVRNYICPDAAWHAKMHAQPHHQFRYFDKGIGNKTLAQLTVGTVTKFRDDLRAAGLSVPTTRKILAMLQVMLAYAISLDLMAINVAKDVEVIGRRDEGMQRIEPPSKEVMRQLIELADENFQVKLLFASATGVRASELHALRWRHISFERRHVKIETRVDPYRDEDVPKTKAGLRTIPLGENVLAALKAWKLRSHYKQPGDLVFPNRAGGYIDHKDMVKRKFQPLFAKLEQRWKEERRNETVEVFTWHALRHFAISCWIDAGLPPKTVQTFAGHSSLQVTMDRYGHLFRSDDHGRAMDAIANEIYAGPDQARTPTQKQPGKPDLKLG